MTNNQWDDDKLEKILHSMPKIEDKRSKELVLERLQQDQRLKNPRRVNPKRWMPAIVALAALLLISLLIPSMLNNNDRAMQESGSPISLKAERSIDREAENEAMEEAETFDTSAAKESAAMTVSTAESYVLLSDELNGAQPLQLGLMESANVIPVTFLIPESKILADFPEGNPTTLELYNKYAAEIPEEELGFDEYHPYNGTLYEEDGVIYHQIPAKHNYDLSSSTVNNYYNSMYDTFSEYDKLQLVDANNNPAVFESVGKSDEEFKKQFPYYKYVMPSGKVYLIPYESAVDTETVVEGLTAMKETNGNIVETLIPENVDYHVRVDEQIAVITFSEQLDITAFDQNELNRMVEGFMLTAKGYNMQVKLENVVQNSIGKYDLSSALPMPIGSNPTAFTQ
ncbi:hypothetical protein MHZ92_02585 [Sporosarcina sp. ACRSL]|uniref:hypothetical protein n=1 Tax=Sporosarcina sp. ACRSL TaxID=2918215 RepID=UPI001EF66420|nr:hypothetical protein [Sporosarcina sp. ACRSL]MCG7343002.1 hypothetical protein [Sporosarcina sp. ACRSL]